MVQITFKAKTGDPIGEILKDIKDFDKTIKQDLDRLGPETLKVIKDYVHDSKVRPQAGEPTNLENALEVEFFSDGNGWGVGDIEKLTKEAPGWAALNWGSSHMVG